MPINDEVAVKLVADIEDLIAGLKTAQEQTNTSLHHIEESTTNVSESFESLKHSVIGGLEAAGITLVYEAMERVKESVDQTAEHFLELKNTAEALQTSVDTLQGLKYGVEELGESGATAEIAMRMLSMRMRAARDGSREAQEGLAKVGITLKDLRDPAFNGMEALTRLGQSTADISDKAALLGRNGYQMREAWETAAQGADALKKKYEELGGLTEAQIEVLKRYHKVVYDATVQWDNFKAKLAVEVAPTIQQVTTDLKAMFEQTSAGKLIFEAVGFAAEIVASAFVIVGSRIASVMVTLNELYEHIKEFVVGLAKIEQQIHSSFNPATVLRNMEKEFDASWQRQVAIADKADKDMQTIAERAKSALKTLWGAKKEAEEKAAGDKTTDETGGGKPRDVKNWQDPELEQLKFRMALLRQGNLEDADERIRLAQQIAAREIETARGSVAQQLAGLAMIEQAVRANEALRRQIAKEELEQSVQTQLASINDERRAAQFRYDMQEISASELLDMRKRLAQQELEIETDKYKKLAELDKDNTVQRQKDLDAIVKAQQKADATIKSATEDAAKQTKQLWTSALHPIVAEFGNAFKGMLNATTSFKGAMQNLYMGLVNHFEDVVIQMTEKWIVGELIKTTATAEGSAARTAITEEEVLMSIAKKIWEGLKWIAVEAQKAFAGAYAAIAGIPYVGPVLAPVAAVGAAAAVMGAASSISAEGGWLVPKDSPVNVHKDEMILPPHLSKGVQEMIKKGGSGGKMFDVHIHAMDGASVDRILNNNPDAVYKAFKRAFDRASRGRR